MQSSSFFAGSLPTLIRLPPSHTQGRIRVFDDLPLFHSFLHLAFIVFSFFVRRTHTPSPPPPQALMGCHPTLIEMNHCPQHIMVLPDLPLPCRSPSQGIPIRVALNSEELLLASSMPFEPTALLRYVILSFSGFQPLSHPSPT